MYFVCCLFFFFTLLFERERECVCAKHTRQRKTIENNKEQPLKQHAEPGIYRRMPTVTLKTFQLYKRVKRHRGTEKNRENQARRMQVMLKNACYSFGRCYFAECIWDPITKRALHICTHHESIYC